ncbi:MAG TPA: septum site-determining protein MinC [Burkholderiaceae bacterium]
MQNKLHKPIEIKISTVVAISAILHAADMAVLEKAMHDMTGGMEDFFDDEFAVIDVAALNGAAVDWAALIKLFKRHHLNPVAVRHAPDSMNAEILAHGLSIDAGAKPREQVAEAPAASEPETPAQAAIEFDSEPAQSAHDGGAHQAAPAAAAAPAHVAAPAPAPAARTMIIDTPVRAGQRIYARGADLVITAMVNNGAEVIADGSIHVYAPLRGRALAGASGNSDARIFAMLMEPELVSIAGVYKTFDDGLPANLKQQPAQVQLIDNRLDMRALTRT